MASGALRWIGGGILLVLVFGAIYTFIGWKEALRQEGRQEVTSAIQQENTKVLQQERETSDRVLVEREKQGAVNDAKSLQAQKQIYEAKPTAYDIDSPLPDSITQPLLMQYQTITSHCESGKDATACGVDDGTRHTRTAQGADSPKSGFVVQ